MDHHRCKFLRRACSEGRSRGFGKRTAQGGRPGSSRSTRSFGRKKPATRNPLETPSSSTVHVSDPTNRLGALELPAPAVGLKRRPQSPALTRPRRHRGRERSSRLSLPGSLARRWQLVERAPRSCHPLLRINLGLCSSRF
ncbi:hypothetical protein GQ55_9G459600 [Panicum hallii var. hallii]|uniref:Uncharacterized protein n=1 Tax=Panicum hallii var. hallii TaxID=1504633 RepID=A0A2T7CC37_9POAL|nr:hypothetical protein GQ55_9G459600 [Panicum hallii var. hallii]